MSSRAQGNFKETMSSGKVDKKNQNRRGGVASLRRLSPLRRSSNGDALRVDAIMEMADDPRKSASVSLVCASTARLSREQTHKLKGTNGILPEGMEMQSGQSPHVSSAADIKHQADPAGGGGVARQWRRARPPLGRVSLRLGSRIPRALPASAERC
eukprot:1663499-Prymnesium_polylepis.1